MTNIILRAMDCLTRFRDNRQGVAAVEFALILPVMLALYMVTVEFQDYFTMDRKLTSMTSAAADVVSQDDDIHAAEIADIFSAVSTMMSPYNTSSLKLRVTSVWIDNNGLATVDWSKGQNYTGRAVGSSYPLPANLVINNTSYIVSESQFSYTAVVSDFLPGGLTLDRTYYVNPRYVDKVTYSP